jgi:hypothetical protein
MSDDNVARFVSKYGNSAKAECSEVPDSVHPHLVRNPNLNKIQTFLPKPTYRLTIWL